jgi:hypothetical protein
MMEQDKVRKIIQHGSATAWPSIYQGAIYSMASQKAWSGIKNVARYNIVLHKAWRIIKNGKKSTMKQYQAQKA